MNLSSIRGSAGTRLRPALFCSFIVVFSHAVGVAQVLNGPATLTSAQGKVQARWGKALVKATTTNWCPMVRQPDGKKSIGKGLSGDCPIEGPPDIPAIRNAHIPDASTRIKIIRLKFNVFGGAGTREDVDAEMALVNAAFLPWRIQFVHETAMISQFQKPLNLRAADELKPIFADSPETQLNVYAVVPMDYTGLIGFGHFPWWPDALSPFGGVVVHPSFLGDGSLLTHEIGHNLGLYHTFAGVSEYQPPCSECYERADGLNGNTTGDLCADTPPTPVHGGCGPPGGIDPCSNTPWGPTMPDNYMSYSTCPTFRFTVQQAGRMHAWILERLATWLVPDVSVSISASPEPAIVGSNLTYMLSVSNRSEIEISEVTVTNFFSTNVFFTSTSSNVNWSALADGIALTFQNIPTGSTVFATITVIPFQPGTVTNVLVLPINASVVGQPTNRAVVVSTAASNPALTGPLLMFRDALIVEGDSGTRDAAFVLGLFPPSNAGVSTDFYTTDASAHAGVDYLGTNGTITFNSGETLKVISVKVIGDRERELDESFVLEIAPVTNAFNLRLQAEGRIITDDFSLDVNVSQVAGPDYQHRPECRNQ
jgi:uncharacterized repeat protein (TIGR01451 family)